MRAGGESGGLLRGGGSGGVGRGPESIYLFIEDKAFSLSYDLPTPFLLSCQQVVSFSKFSYVSRSSLLTGEGGWGRSQIVRWRASLVPYKSFKTLRVGYRGKDREECIVIGINRKRPRVLCCRLIWVIRLSTVSRDGMAPPPPPRPSLS
jgi:hypothetical protein